MELVLRDLIGAASTAAISRDFGGFREAATQPAMGYVLVHARVPYGDHIETRDLDRRLEHDQPLIVFA